MPSPALLDVNVLIALVERLLSSSQVTDTYLFALAHAKGGLLATFDRKLVTSAVTGGADALLLLA